MRSLWWGGVGGLGVIIKSNLNRARLSCCWVVFGLGCDKNPLHFSVDNDVPEQALPG